MSELNAFNNPDGDLGDAFTCLLWTALGIVALFVAFAVGPEYALALSGSLFVFGTPVALASPRRRPIAAGLAAAGATPAVVLFIIFWLAALGSVLPG